MLHHTKDISAILALDLVGERRVYSRNSIILDQEKAGDKGILLLSGKARTYLITVTGEERLINYPSSGSFFGESALFYSPVFKPWNMVSKAITTCNVIEMSKKDIVANVFKFPEFFTLLMESASAKFINFSLSIQCSTHATVSLMAQVIISLFSIVTEKQTNPFTIKITHEEISQITGRSRVSVTNALGKLQEQGYLKLSRGQIRILKPNELWAMMSE